MAKGIKCEFCEREATKWMEAKEGKLKNIRIDLCRKHYNAITT